jgi:Zn-dependent protease with chaperone function
MLYLAEMAFAVSTPTPGPEGLSVDQVTDAFTGSTFRTAITVSYRIALLLVTAATILLPLVYLAVITVVAWCGYYYFVWIILPQLAMLAPYPLGHFYAHSRGMSYGSSFGGRGGIGGFLIFDLAIPLTGLVLLAALVKPVVTPRRRSPALALDPELQPALFAFVGRICLWAGAPMPARIEMDCQLNATADFRRGVRSLFGNDLTLRLGLPLVAGLSLRELTGVIAHEMGHFSQGFGLRLAWVVRAVNDWFTRMVFERDALDAWLKSFRENDVQSMMTFPADSALFVLEGVRGLLKIPMYAGRAMSGFLVRRMEFDADSYEIKLAGSEAFCSTTARLAVLGVALRAAQKDARATWNLNRWLPDDLAANMLLQEAQVTPVVRERLEAALLRTKTGLLDTHPSDADRIDRARQANEPGIFGLELPAAAVFSHFDALAREATFFHYSQDLGLSVNSANLRPVRRPASGQPEPPVEERDFV